MSVAVVGAGIVGLTTAAHIQDLLPDVQVTIIADKLNAETTSDGAAGLFYPSANFKGPTPTSANDWIKYSYKYYDILMKENCGIFEVTGYNLSSDREEDVHNDLMKSGVPVYRAATPQELLHVPGNWKYGVFIQTLIIRCRTFLPWLMDKIKSKGGKVVKKIVQEFSELTGQYDVVVNCTGLQSRWLCNDDRVVPIRGQILKVHKPSIKQFYYLNGPDTYIIPFGDGIVSLGGTYQFNIWDTQVRQHDSVGIRARCSVVAGLADAPTVWEWAGLRPHRECVRVEPEIRGSLKLVHNYGHGGYGVTMAPGSARDAAELVQQLLQTKGKL